MKIILAAGARPNFMKVAPILEALEARRRAGRPVEPRLVHTGQHYDRRMSEEFFADLGLPAPDRNLGVGSGSHAQQTARVMVAFEEVCLEERPDWVVVVGDVNSTLACALAAKKLGLRLAHVEAGLRSRDMSMPEEINRLCTDAIADLLFTTDRIASENLRREGVEEARIRLVGNTMIDSLYRHLPRARSLPLPEGLEAGRYAVLTLHRPGNVDDPPRLLGILAAVSDLARRLPVIFPAHPRTRAHLDRLGWRPQPQLDGRLRLTEPLSYLPFLGLVARARLVLTDSGGLQEETTVLGVPCLTLRETTERPITCQIGTNILVGSAPERIRAAAWSVLENGRRPAAVPEHWDGRAGERIAACLLEQASG